MTLYPALDAWKRRREHPRKYETWHYDVLWRSACAEAEARENQKNPEREQQCQREAIGILLDEPTYKVKLNSTWARRFVAQLSELKDRKAV